MLPHDNVAKEKIPKTTMSIFDKCYRNCKCFKYLKIDVYPNLNSIKQKHVKICQIFTTKNQNQHFDNNV